MLIHPVSSSPRGLAAIESTSTAEWDALVAAHPGGHLLQSWCWGDFKAEFGWRPLRVWIAGGAADNPPAAAQLLIRRFMGLSVCYVPRGPLFSGDPDTDRLLLATLQRIARRHRAAFLRLEPNVLESDSAADALHSLLQVAGYRCADPMQPRTSIHLPLESTPDHLWSAFSKGHRADVRRAERSGVVVRVGTTQADLDTFYSLMEATAARAEFAIHSREYYRRAWELGGEHARLLLASTPEAEDVAGFLVFAFGREGQYMYSASTADGLKIGANHLLQWHAIRWVRERGCASYDLWGVPEVVGDLTVASDAERAQIEERAKAHPLYGAYRFKKGWGGRVVRYLPAYDRVLLPPVYWLWRRRNDAAQGGA